MRFGNSPVVRQWTAMAVLLALSAGVVALAAWAAEEAVEFHDAEEEGAAVATDQSSPDEPVEIEEQHGDPPPRYRLDTVDDAEEIDDEPYDDSYEEIDEEAYDAGVEEEIEEKTRPTSPSRPS
jgi:hypothetical protein